MNRPFLTAALLVISLASQISAHDLQHSVSQENAVVITIAYWDETSFAFEQYELFRPGETVPFQTGRTDVLGRVIFLPDMKGAWRFRAFSEDGHGLDISIDIDEQGIISKKANSLFQRYQRIVIGVAVILGIFGLITVFLRKGKS
jgi:nickel transport protein